MDRTPGATRITIANDNVAGVLGHVLSALADAKVNVLDMSNRSRDALAYNIIDVETAPDAGVIGAIGKVDGVIRVRVV
jgi:D-3-phosphoglycerate dehydrogenase